MPTFYRKAGDPTVYKDPQLTQGIRSEAELRSLGGVPDWGPTASKTNIVTVQPQKSTTPSTFYRRLGEPTVYEDEAMTKGIPSEQRLRELGGVPDWGPTAGQTNIRTLNLENTGAGMKTDTGANTYNSSGLNTGNVPVRSLTETPEAPRKNSYEIFNTALMDMLKEYQQMGTRGLQERQLELSNQQAGKILAESPTGFSPGQQSAMRSGEASAISPSIQGAADRQQTFQQQLAGFGNVLESSRQYAQSQMEAKVKHEEDTRNMIKDTIDAYGPQAFTGVDDKALAEMEKEANYPKGYLKRVMQAAQERKRMAQIEQEKERYLKETQLRTPDQKDYLFYKQEGGTKKFDEWLKEQANLKDKSASSPSLPVSYIEWELAGKPGTYQDWLKKEQKGQEETNKQLQYNMGKADETISLVDKALNTINNKGWAVSGWGSLFSYLPASDAKDFQGQINSIKANIGFNELQQMRAASPTGGALGQVAVQELNMLQSVLGSLDISQKPETLKKNLEEIKTHFQNWKDAITQAQAQGDNNSLNVQKNYSAGIDKSISDGQEPKQIVDFLLNDPDVKDLIEAGRREGRSDYSILMDIKSLDFPDEGSVSKNAQSKLMRTDRSNNPTAMTTDVAKTGGLVLGVDYKVGDPFPNNPKLKTAILLGNPVDKTIKAIDKMGFYTASGKQRWTHTAMSKSEWNKLSYSGKAAIIRKMYNAEGNKGVLNNYFV